MDVKIRLIHAVNEGNLDVVTELINSFGLSYSQAWSDGYVLLCNALKNHHAAVAKLLLTRGSKVNSKSQKPTDTPLHFAATNGDIEIAAMLVDRGSNIFAQNQYGRTPLHNAIESKNVEVTELLLKHGALVYTTYNDGRSPLHVAVQKGCLQIVEHLLKYGAYVNCVCTSEWRKGLHPLHFAVEEGNKEIITLLLSKGANIDVKEDTNGTAPLHIAAKKGYETIVELLLQNGAKVDNQDKNGKTVLQLAVKKGYLRIIENVLKYCPDINNQSNRSSLKAALHRYGEKYKKIVEVLLEYGFNVDPEDANNPNLFQDAIEKGFLKIVEDLLKYGANVNMLLNSTFKGFTPLHSAAKNKQEEIAKLLISYKADVNAQDKTGKTPIFYAIENADLKMCKLLLTYGINVKDNPELLNTAVKTECIEIVEALLQHDADINAIDKHGRTALHYTALRTELHYTALRKSYYTAFSFDPLEFCSSRDDEDIKGEIAKLLLSKGANVNSQIKNGITPLHAATEKGYAKVVEALLEYNANVNVNSGVKSDTTPLHLSAQSGNKEITTMLLNKGANVNAKLNIGFTALHIASQKGHESVVKILLECGASINSSDKYGRTELQVAAEEGHVEVVVTLLDYGSDINITNRNNNTPFDCTMAQIRLLNNQVYDDDDDDYYYFSDRGVCPYKLVAETLKRHMVKMKTANLYVSKQNLLSMGSNYESYFQDKCEEEIVNMKSEKINNANISFYDILTKGTSSLAKYMKNENIVQTLKADDYETKFPIYASMIRSNVRKAMERKVLLEQGNTIFHFLFNNLPELPDYCTEKIFSYMSDDDLRILMEACKPLSICNR